MKENPANRDKWLTIRTTAAEYDAISRIAHESTCRSISEYARKTLANKPVIMRYRNQSLDDFMTGMLKLQKDLKSIAANFNQSVRHLQTLRSQSDLQQWIIINEQDKTILFRQIETISSLIKQSYQLWSRE